MGKDTVRYAVVGLGYFAQAAILPAFERLKNSELVALFSDDSTKLHKLGARYAAKHLLPYEAYGDFLDTGQIDAVYIALPNSLHAEYAVRAANAHKHVLCEKPMAVTEQECLDMIEAARKGGVRLMTAYRLHFEPANLTAIDIARSGVLGALRSFDSSFFMQVREGNARLRAALGGGPLFDLGIYCINAARYLFEDEPIEVSGIAVQTPTDPRFREVEEQIAGVLRFGGERLATFVVGFGGANVSRYQLVGTEGYVRLDPAYPHSDKLRLESCIGGKLRRKKFRRRDQIASEIMYFSECILEGREPEPSGFEGLADVRVMRALLESANAGKVVRLDPMERRERPQPSQERHVPAHREPRLVHAEPPSK